MASLIFPPGARLLSVATETFPLPPRDTGTPLGVLERQPMAVYRWAVVCFSSVAADTGMPLNPHYVEGRPVLSLLRDCSL